MKKKSKFEKKSALFDAPQPICNALNIRSAQAVVWSRLASTVVSTVLIIIYLRV